MDFNNRQTVNTIPDGNCSLKDLLKRSEALLGTIQNARNKFGDEDLQNSTHNLEQREVQIRDEKQTERAVGIESKPCYATTPMSAYDSYAIAEAELDALIKELNLDEVISKPASQKSVEALEEIEKELLQNQAFRIQLPDDGIHSISPSNGKPDTISKNTEKNVISEQSAADDIGSGGGLPSFPDVSIFETPMNLKTSPENDLQNETKKRLPKPIFKTLRITLYSIIIVLMVFSIFVAVNQRTGAPVFGYRFYNVISNSMDGMINKGSLVMTKETPIAELISGDVITFKTNQVNSEPITHQIIEIIYGENGSKSFVTKGCNNSTADPSPVNPEMILGKVVFHMPIVGGVFGFVSQYMFLILIIVLIGMAVFLLFFMPNKAKKNEKQIEEDIRMAPYGSYVQKLSEKSESGVLPFVPVGESAAEPKPHIAAQSTVDASESYVPYVQPVDSPQPARNENDFNFSNNFEFQSMFNKTAEDYLVTESAISDQSINQVLEELQSILYQDSKKDIEVKVSQLLRNGNKKIYSDLQAAIAQIKNDQSDLLSEIDKLIDNDRYASFKTDEF